MRDRRPPRNTTPRLEWPGGIVPEWAKPQGNPNKRRRGGKGKHGQGQGGGGGGPGGAKRERLQKVMAQSGHGSRRNLEILIAQGHITINGQVAKLGDLVGPGDRVKLDGEFITLRFGEVLPRVLMYHKPEGEIVTRDDPEGRATVFEKLPKVNNGRWVAIGRLDLNSGGLLLFTTSGELANRMMHPRFEVEREFAVRVMGEITGEARAKLLDGVDVEGEKCAFDSIEDRGGSEEGSNHWYHVVLREGKNREVRRMFEAVGLMVSRLMRVRFGPVAMPTFLKRGMTKEMDEAQTQDLMDFAGMNEPPASVAPPAGAEPDEDDDLQPPGLSHMHGLAHLRGNTGSAPGQGQGHGQGQQRRGPRPQPQGGPGQGQNPQQKFGGKPGKHRKRRKGHGQQGQHGQGQQGQQRHEQQGPQDHGQQAAQDHGHQAAQDHGHQAAQDHGQQAAQDHGQPGQPGEHGQQGGGSQGGSPGQHRQGQGKHGSQGHQGQHRKSWKGGGQGKPGGHRNKQGQGGARGDEQPRYNEPAETQRGDEQPLTNENRRVW